MSDVVVNVVRNSDDTVVRTFSQGPQIGKPCASSTTNVDNFTWDGTDDGGGVVADGVYRVEITGTPTDGGTEATATYTTEVDTVPVGSFVAPAAGATVSGELSWAVQPRVGVAVSRVDVRCPLPSNGQLGSATAPEPDGSFQASGGDTTACSNGGGDLRGLVDFTDRFGQLHYDSPVLVAVMVDNPLVATIATHPSYSPDRSFSPNGDGYEDTTKRIYYCMSRDVSDVVVNVVRNSDDTVVRTFSQGPQIGKPCASSTTNVDNFTWDGTDDGGGVVADGVYRVEITGTPTDGGTEATATYTTEVDTVPVGSFVAPAAGATVSGELSWAVQPRVGVAVSRVDVRCPLPSNGQLGSATAPEPDGSFQASGGDTTACSNGGGDLRGLVDFTDRFGQLHYDSPVLVAVMVDNPLVATIATHPSYSPDRSFSPNGDGYEDTTKRIYYCMSRDVSDVVVNVVRNSDDTVVRTFSQGPQIGKPCASSTTNVDNFTWDGTDDGGGVVADGVYRVEITGTPTDGGTEATATYTTEVDTVLPATMLAPVDNDTLAGLARFSVEPRPGIAEIDLSMSTGGGTFSIFGPSPDGVWRTTRLTGEFTQGPADLRWWVEFTDPFGQAHRWPAPTVPVTIDQTSIPVSFSADPISGPAPLQTTFTLEASEPNGEVLDYTLEFGDGQSTSGAIVSPYDPMDITHTYATVGEFDATVTVSSAGVTTPSVRTVAIETTNVAPQVDAGGPYPTVDEGSPVSLDGMIIDDNLDPDSILWSGSGGTFLDANSEDTTWTPVDEGTGSYTLTLSASDLAGQPGSDTVVIDVVNVTPTIDLGSLSVTTSIVEGDESTLTGAFSDPGVDDIHTATVDWNEGDGPVEVDVSESPGEDGGTVDGTNLYEQDGTYDVTLCIDDDDDPPVCETIEIVVTNADPTIDVGTLSVTTPIVEGDVSTLTADFSDAGVDDVHNATVDWGEGDGPVTVDVTEFPGMGGGSISGTNQYDTAGTYTVELCIDDGDSDPVCESTEIVVESGNLAPVANPGGPYDDVVEGTPATLDGSGSDDPDGSILEWEWTSVPTATFADGDTAMPTFTADENGDYEVTLRVRDNVNTWSDPVSVTIPVANAAPVVTVDGPSTVGVDQESSWSVSFTDDGQLDAHTARIDWDGDGTPDETIDPAESPFDITHTFTTPTDATPEIVEVCVTDDDHSDVGNGEGCETIDVTVIDGPTAVDDEFEVAEGAGTLTLEVVANDEPDPTDLTITGNTQLTPVEAGSVVSCTGGTCTVEITAGFTDSATFGYTIEDGDGLEDDATVEITVRACADLTGAFAEPIMSDGAPWDLVTGQAWEECADVDAHATAGPNLTPILTPDSDGTVALLTTGLASVADNPNVDTASERHGREYNGAKDASVLRLDLDVPAIIDVETDEGDVEQRAPRCLTFDVVFATEEYPEYTEGTTNPYNDGFLAELGATGWSANGTAINAPNNFAFDPDGEVISVNSAFFDDGRVIKNADTGMIFDGASPVLRARTPIDPGAQPLFLSVFDGGDDGNDSAAIVDHFQLLSTPCSGGLSQPPVAVDDGYTIDEDEPDLLKRVFEILDAPGDDFDPDGDEITILRAPVDPPSPLRSDHGTVVVDNDRTYVTYTPDRHFWGTDTFEYTITDLPNATGAEDVDDVSRATVDITINEVNDAPRAFNDYVSTPPSPRTIPVLGNDWDPDNYDGVSGNEDTLEIVDHTPASQGEVSCSTTQCTYTPYGPGDLTDVFRYTVEDGRGGSDTATVFINVPPPLPCPGEEPCNEPPTADAGGPYDGSGCDDPCAGIPLDGSASSDSDGEIVSWTWLVEEPGVLSGADGPTPQFTSPDGGVFKVWLIVCDDDGACGADTAVVVDFVAQVTSPINEGSAATATINFFNPGGDLVATVDWDGDGIADDVADPAIFPVTKTRTFPQDGSFDVEMCVSGSVVVDGEVVNVDVCDSAPLEVDNVLPDVNAGVDRTLLPGGTLTQIRMFFRDPGEDADWTATVNWGDGSDPEIDDTSVVPDQDTKLLEMVTGHVYPDLGTYVVTICVQDDDAEGCDDFEVEVSLMPPPNAVPGGPYEADEGQSIVLDGSGSDDPDGEIVSWAWTTPDAGVTLGDVDPVAPAKTTFVAEDDGEYTVSLEVCDDDGQCDSESVLIPVANVAPTVDPIADLTALPDVEVNASVSFSDPGVADGDWTVTVDWVGDGAVDETTNTGQSPLAIAHTYPAAGEYPVEVCVTDKDGDDSCVSFRVDVTDTPPPTADPGGPYEPDEGETVPLDGSGSYDPDGSIVSWSWTTTDPNVTLTDEDTPTPLFLAADDGTYEVTLQVCDNDGQCSSADVDIPVVNVAPSVEPPTDRTTGVGEEVTVSVSFTDPGVLDTHTATVDWDGDGTVDQTIDPATSPFDIAHTFTVAGTYAVEVCVTDDGDDGDCVSFGVEASDVPPPTAVVGGPYEADEGQSIVLDGTGSFDPDGSVVSWSWTATDPGVVLIDADTPAPSFEAADDGDYTVSLVVCDNDGLCSDPAEATIPVANVAPTVDPIDDLTVVRSVPFDLGVSFSDPGRLDTHSAQVSWGDGSPDANVDPVFSPFDVPHLSIQSGTFDAIVCVTDDAMDEGCAPFQVTVLEPPDPDPGGPYEGTVEGEEIDLDGSGSRDADGEIVSWSWTATDSNVSLTDADTPTPSFEAADNGEYMVSLEVCDDDGLCASEEVIISVANVEPTVDPVADRTAVPGELVAASVSFSDPGALDTHVAVVAWGDGSPDDDVDPVVSPFAIAHTYAASGAYAIEVCVTDKDGDTGCTGFEVEVSATPPPTADAGGPYAATEGETIPLDGSASFDPDGVIVSWAWSSADAGVTLGGVDTPTPSFEAADDGEYAVSLEVCDDDGQCDTDEVTIPVANVEPTVDPLADRVVLTGEELSLPVSFTDPGILDPHTARIDWGDGSSVDQLDPATSPFDIGHTYASEGTYVVSVCLTDDDGGIGCATFEVEVSDTPPEPNLAVDDVTGAEGDSGTTEFLFTVSLDGPAPGDVTFDHQTNDLTAEVGLDYVGGSGTGLIPAGDTETTVSVTVLGDRRDEPDETFEVEILNVSGAVPFDALGLGVILDGGDRCTILGTPGNDTLEGTPGTDVICAEGGDDLIIATPGADEYLGDAGVDTVDYRAATSAPIVVNLATDSTSGWAVHDLNGIESAVGGPNDDLLVGDAGANALDGAGGDDIVRASGGGDVMEGGPGLADRIGYATVPDAAAGVGVGVLVDLRPARTRPHGFGALRAVTGTPWDVSDQLTGFENVYGTVYDDVIFGDGNANRIWGSAGADSIVALAGDDVVFGGDSGSAQVTARTASTSDRGRMRRRGRGEPTPSSVRKARTRSQVISDQARPGRTPSTAGRTGTSSMATGGMTESGVGMAMTSFEGAEATTASSPETKTTWPTAARATTSSPAKPEPTRSSATVERTRFSERAATMNCAGERGATTCSAGAMATT